MVSSAWRQSLTPEQAVAYARQFESDGANAVYIMSTAKYPFERFIEMSREVKKKPEARNNIDR